VSTALQTEQRAFESLYRLHRPLVYSYALTRLHQPADAEDVAQATFLKAYYALRQGAVPLDTERWLITIAKNVCRDRFREAKRRPRQEPLDERVPAIQPPELLFSLQDVCREISMLSPRYRTIITMREFEGRSFAEIAASLGYTETAVQAHLVRARRSLRERLELAVTCDQARRVALRDLNGVAVLEERRAMKRHLRRCADCATFVGQKKPRTPVARALWLTTMPFRRLINIFSASSVAPVGSTAGGAGALAAKLVTLGAVGTAAVGVSVTALGTDTSHHAPPTPATRHTASPVRHSAGTARSFPATTHFRKPGAPSVPRRVEKRTAHAAATPVTGSTSTSPPPSTPFAWLTSAPAETSTPSPPAATDPPQDAQPETAPSPPSGGDPDATATAAPATSAAAVPSSSGAAAADASNSSSAQPDASTVAASTPAASAPPSSTPATSTPTSTTPVTTPPSPPTQASGHGNAVGPGATPPAHAGGKPDAPPGRP
jgi:RNA polymerase sigma factor (sigma-70 family)